MQPGARGYTVAVMASRAPRILEYGVQTIGKGARLGRCRPHQQEANNALHNNRLPQSERKCYTTALWPAEICRAGWVLEQNLDIMIGFDLDSSQSLRCGYE